MFIFGNHTNDNKENNKKGNNNVAQNMENMNG